MRVDDADLRVRLEGRAEVLDAARLRYRELADALTSFRWKAKFRGIFDVVHEVVREEPKVEDALRYTARQAHKWPTDSEVTRCVREVEDLRKRVEAALEQRLGKGSDRLHLGPALSLLSGRVLFAPRVVLPGERWPLANQLLRTSLAAEREQVLAFGLAVEALFSREVDPAHTLPFSLLEWDDVAKGWTAGDAALETALSRLALLDVTGGLGRALRRKGRHVPRAAFATPVEQLSHALHWRATALRRIDEVMAARLAPVTARPEERFQVMRYLMRRERDATARLDSDGLQRSRAALMELAHELTGLPQERPVTVGGWDALLRRAAVADSGVDETDWPKVREGLQALVRVVSAPAAPPLSPLYRSLARLTGPPPKPPTPTRELTLFGLVQLLHERSDVLPVRSRRR